jgi:hypothetical protein
VNIVFIRRRFNKKYFEVSLEKCYASNLGDCEGTIEDEHFIPKSLQTMLGPITLSGFAWQKGSSNKLMSGSYAHARVICRKHHDELDGLDANAAAYFRNLMLIIGQNHLQTGIAGRIEDITTVIDGRALERWFMKTICGAIGSKTFKGINDIPDLWTRGLFGRIPWPDEWAMYVATFSDYVTQPEDVATHIDFHWAKDNQLNGIVISAFAVQTSFSIKPPDLIKPQVLRRPSGLGFAIQRPDGSDILEGVPAGQHIQFRLVWPK